MRTVSQARLMSKLAAALADGKIARQALYETVAMFVMVADPAVPKMAKAEVVAALLYLINPFDLIPDMLPTGLIDDVALLGVTWKLIQRHITDEHKAKARKMVQELLLRLNLSQEIPADMEISGDGD